MKPKWTNKKQGDAATVEQLSKELNINQTLSRLLVQRGITTFEEARKFFRPELNDLHDPFLMKDMDIAVGRLRQAIQNKEAILVYGDYDVDGTTSVAMVYSFLSHLHEPLDYYIPDRYTEGYGISRQGIDYAIDHNVSLIIALDCGIKALEQTSYAKSHGIDLIICDHHLPGETLPEAIAILDPKRPDCGYPYKELSGCGIGFKLLQAYTQNTEMPLELLEGHLDFVAISIACDIVPLTDENRILAFFGLQKLNSAPRQGIKALLDIAEASYTLTIQDLVFVIGPRINAAGRIEHGKKAVELLISTDHSGADIQSQAIDANNSHRKGIDKDITQHAIDMMEANSSKDEQKSIVLYHESWHKGVVGIVASRLIERYYKPTILLTITDGKATGSARSVRGFSVYKALLACDDLLEQYGGHKYAAGLTLKVENLPAFQKKFEEVVAATIQPESLFPQIDVDSELHLDEITPKFFRILKQLAPFGPGNPNPTFVSKRVVDAGDSRAVGESKYHLKLDVTPSDRTVRISGIGFGMGDYATAIKTGNAFDIAYSIEENEWKGNRTLQLKVKDLHMEH